MRVLQVGEQLHVAPKNSHFAFVKIMHTSCSPGMKLLPYTFLLLLAPCEKRMMSVQAWRKPHSNAMRFV